MSAQLGAAVDEPATPAPPGMPEGEEEAEAAPRPKPYADATGVFAKLIKLLPLATDDEVATFERRARRFTRRLGPLSLGRLVDDRQRPILWYACDTVWKSKFYGSFVLNHRVVLHAIDATPARWRGDAGSSPLDRARSAAHPTHWLISTQVRQ